MKLHIKRNLITGLAALMPAIVTFYLIYLIFMMLHNNIGVPFNAMLRIPADSPLRLIGDIVSVIVLLVIIWLAGFALATYIGRAGLKKLDEYSHRIPIVRFIYPSVRQVTDFFMTKQTVRFNRVVAVEYPRKGIYTLGFVTGDGLDELDATDGVRKICIFVANSPTPFTGFTIFAPETEFVSLNLTVDEAVKILVSGGVLTPAKVAALAKTEGTEGEGDAQSNSIPADSRNQG